MSLGIMISVLLLIQAPVGMQAPNTNLFLLAKLTSSSANNSSSTIMESSAASQYLEALEALEALEVEAEVVLEQDLEVGPKACLT